jgi:hypothetical protein
MRVGILGTGRIGEEVIRQAGLLVPDADLILLSGSLRRQRHLIGHDSKVRGDDDGSLDCVLASVPGPVIAAHLDQLAQRTTLVVSASETLDPTLDRHAVQAGVDLRLGANLSPGWTRVLLRHAEALFDSVVGVDIAVTGSTGPTCRSTQNDAAKGLCLECRNGTWSPTDAGTGLFYRWFPPPLEQVECTRFALLDLEWCQHRYPQLEQLVGLGFNETGVDGRVRRQSSVGGVSVEMQGWMGESVGDVSYCLAERTERLVATMMWGAALSKQQRVPGARWATESIDVEALLSTALAVGIQVQTPVRE